MGVIISEAWMHFITEKFVLDFVSYSQVPSVLTRALNFKIFLSSQVATCFGFPEISELHFLVKCFSSYSHLFFKPKVSIFQ